MFLIIDDQDRQQKKTSNQVLYIVGLFLNLADIEKNMEKIIDISRRKKT